MAKIEKTDALIDEIVSELFGLTDDKIEIVEAVVGVIVPRERGCRRVASASESERFSAERSEAALFDPHFCGSGAEGTRTRKRWF